LLVKLIPRIKDAGPPTGPSVAVVASVGGIKFEVFEFETANPSLVSVIVFESKYGAFVNGSTMGRVIAWYTAVSVCPLSVLLVLLNAAVESFDGIFHEFTTPFPVPVVAIVSVNDAGRTELLSVSVGVENAGFGKVN
jgi:hypothetical protein